MQSSHSQSQSSFSSEEDMPVARLNDTYDLVKVIGKGSTAKVWLARYVEDPSLQFAIKIMSSQYMRHKGARQGVKKEVDILSSLDHEGVIQLYEYGDKGVVQYDGKIYNGQVYIVMEYVAGPLLFDLAKKMGSMGEEIGRFFAKQMIEQLEYINGQNVVHRDIKLENILVDENMDLKLADFGFATDKDIESLSSFRGTQSYMAPEIRSGESYNGKQTDIFSMGVVLFTLVVGYFPFSTASQEDQFYQFLTTGERDENGINAAYWKTLKASHLSTEFKDLMQQIFNEDGSKRPTLEQIKQHPWYKDKIDINQTEYIRKVLLNCSERGDEARAWLKCYMD